MEIKSYVNIEIKKNDRVYHFFMPVGAPFGEAYDASFEALTKVTEFAREAAENAKQKKAEEATPEESNR